MLKKSLCALVAGAMMAAAVASTPAEAATNLRVQTSTQSGGFSFKYMNEVWTPLLKEMTGGEITIEFLPIKSVMPRRETIDGVAAGVLSGDLTSISYFSGRNPAFSILGDLIAGYDSPEQVQSFCRYGGGAEALQALYDKMMPGKIHVVGCGPVSKEALVSKVPIRGVADLKGVKIRSPEGLASDVFRAAGTAPVSLPFSEVFTSREKGVVDTADASAYVNNDANGFNQIAKYPLYPGIHSMAVHQFTINKRIWDKFSDTQKMIVKAWYYAAYDDLRRTLDLKDRDLAARDTADPNVEVINWSQDDRDKFRAIAAKVWEEVAAKSPEARAALDAHLAYMKRIGLIKN